MLKKLLATTVILPFTTFHIMSLPAVAQQSPTQVTQVQSEPDVVALRYFARTNQRDRFDKELTRLQETFPEFKPTLESFLNDLELDQTLWELFNNQQLETLESEIAKRKKLTPFWKPNKELLQKLELAKTRVKIVQAFDRNDFPLVVQLIGDNGAFLKNSDLEIIWIAGIALSRENHQDAAYEMFEFGVDRGATSAQFPVLLQKAARYLVFSESAYFLRKLDLDGMEKERAAEILEHYHRGIILRSADMRLAFPPTLKTGIEKFGQNAVLQKRHHDTELLAWTYFNLQQYQEASRWFDALPADAVSPKLIQGKILSLRNTNNLTQALYLADRWKDLSPEITSMYINLNAPILRAPLSGRLDDVLLSEYQARTLKSKNAEGAEALGWYEVNSGIRLGESDWFTLAETWRDENLDSIALVEGKILGLKNTDRLQEARILSSKWRAHSKKFAQLFVDLHVSMFSVEQSATVSAGFISEFGEATKLAQSSAGAEALAWYNLSQEQDSQADIWFGHSISWSKVNPSENAKLYEGKIIALKRVGKLSQARALAQRWRNTRREIALLYIDLNAGILLDPAVEKQENDFINAYIEITNRYRSSQGAEALGWYLINTKQAQLADGWFDKALKWKSNFESSDQHASASKLLEGRIIASNLADAPQEALRLASENANLSKGVAEQFILLHAESMGKPNSLERSRVFLDRYAEITERHRFEVGAEALGWYALNRENFEEADSWFDRAITWNETETAVFGKALNASKGKLEKEFITVKKRYANRYERVAKLKYGESSILNPSRYDELVNAMVAANEKKQFETCDTLGGELADAGLALGKDYELRGWCQINRKQFKSAEVSFAKALEMDSAKTSDASYGLSLATLRQGKLKQAANLAKSLEEDRKNAIMQDILGRQALHLYRNKRYRQTISFLDKRNKFGAEDRGFTEIRGWALLKSGRKKSALKIFRQLDNQRSTRATRRAIKLAKKG